MRCGTVRRLTRRLSMTLAGGAGWLLAAAGDGYAQRGALVADRPDFTEAPQTVGRGVFQLEFGYTLEYEELGDRSNHAGGDDAAWTHSLGEPLLRAGVFADWLELRLGLSPVSQRVGVDGRSLSETGMEDLYLGIKLALTGQDGARPAIALLPQITVPTGNEAFSSDRNLPGVNLIYAWDLSDDVSLAGSTQVNRAVDESASSYAEWAQSLATGLGIGARMGLYAEWFALFHAEAGGTRAEHYANGGLAWSVNDDVQWDIRAGVGLNEAATDFFLGTGLALRIP